MRLLSFATSTGSAWGVRLGENVVDMQLAAPQLPATILELLAAGPTALAAAMQAAQRASANEKKPLTALTLLPPIPRPGKIACVGLNYGDHVSEAGLAERPAFPGMFHRVSTSLVGHGDAIVRPRVSEQLDFEGELLVIVGERCKDVGVDEALNYVAGYSIFNDASIRDYQQHRALAAGKNFDCTGGFGPEIVTVDELPGGAVGLKLQTRLNGEIMQQTTTAFMLFNVAEIVAMLSEIHTLEAGDIIATGTCAGVGAVRKPPVWMKPGDVIEVEIEGIGILRNTIVGA